MKDEHGRIKNAPGNSELVIEYRKAQRELRTRHRCSESNHNYGERIPLIGDTTAIESQLRRESPDKTLPEQPLLSETGPEMVTLAGFIQSNVIRASFMKTVAFSEFKGLFGTNIY